MPMPRRAPLKRLLLGGAAALLLALHPAVSRAQPTALQQMAPAHMPQMQTGFAPLPEANEGSLVARWLLVADRIALGVTDPPLTAALAIAMHDTLNAIDARHPRWLPGASALPGAAAEPALSMAAFQVLGALYPATMLRNEAQALLLEALRATPEAARGPSIALGAAIGTAVAARLLRPASIDPFPVSEALGKWRPTPPIFDPGAVSNALPLLFAGRDGVRGPPPPAIGSPRYLADREEVRRLGAFDSPSRSIEQTQTAIFWAGQSSQRGFMHLAMRLLRQEPPAGGLWGEAHLLSILAASLLDSALLAWEEKRFHAHWRPITAITLGGDGGPVEAGWTPLLPTPAHPDYPSGHAADCGAGAAVLAALLGDAGREVVYVAIEPQGRPQRRFPTFTAAAEECAESRVWAGAHFAFANDEGLRIGRVVAARALERMAR